jgi:hypothetical protein
MKKTLKYSLLFLFISALCAFAGDNETSRRIEWGTKRLTWDDFQGKINSHSSGIASTWSYMDLDIISSAGDSAVIDLVAVFSKTKSWVAYEEKTVLKHENGHFDITELWTRKLRKKISETKFTAADFKSQLRKLYFEYDDKMDHYQDKYDAETESSMNSEQQKAWEAKIQQKLSENASYNQKRMVIRF